MVAENFKNVLGATFNKRDGVELIKIENKYSSAIITTLGGSVLSYTPKHQQDLLWVSKSAVYDGSKPIRGGIPV